MENLKKEAQEIIESQIRVARDMNMADYNLATMIRAELELKKQLTYNNDKLKEGLKWLLNEYINCVNDSDAITEKIEKLIESEWISVEDRLPSIYSENYLVFSNGIIKQSLFRGDWMKFQCQINEEDDIVTYWQPLPKPPIQTK